MSEKPEQSDEAWRKKLTPEQYHICREKGTEPPFTGTYVDCKDRGVYRCICCNTPLFKSTTKFNSGTGWPSFWDAINDGSVDKHVDGSLAMRRVEVTCSHCDAHLGHVFEDGPQPTGMRYCINSASLKFEKDS